jgi:hypothetical protein
MDEASAEPDKPPQGWFVDPFGAHEQRWISQGRPTALVRDGRVEAQDPPPDRPMHGPLVPAGPAGAPTRPSGDRVRAHGPRLVDPGDRSGFSGNPTGGSVGMTTDRPTDGARAIDPTDRARTPTTPRRLLRLRWITLGGAVVWTALVCLELFAASTTVATSGGHRRAESVYTAHPAGVLSFVVLLIACDAVVAGDFVRRVRAHSERWGVAGCVCACLLGVLGVLSLATVGLSLVLLAFLLFVVARPLRRPRPIIGERVLPAAAPTDASDR